MIIRISGRTDIIQHYSDWLIKRFEQGYVFARNPLFQNKVTRYELTPDKVDCVVLNSKNYKPILPHISSILERFPIYCYYTITAYGKDIEPGIPSIEESISTLIQLSQKVGKERIAWCYDPVFRTEKYSIDMHLKTFETIARQTAPYISRCLFSFMELNKKMEKAMPELIPLTEHEKELLAEGFGKTAAHYGIPMQSCGRKGKYDDYGIKESGCLTLDMVGTANDLSFRDLRHRGYKEGCTCIESRDIGAYQTCSSGCKYCIRNNNPEKISTNQKLFDVNSPLLIGTIKETDTLQQGQQKSFLNKKG